MNIQVVQIPYDSGHFCTRTGCGPDYFLKNGVRELLQKSGHHYHIHSIKSEKPLDTEIGTFFELNKNLAQYLKSLSEDYFPLVFSGNCNSCVGTLAGIKPEDIGIVWFDAHGDYNTPETTLSGFLDGMGLAMATGQCWKNLLPQIPGYKAIPGDRVIQVGAIALDIEEKIMLEKNSISIITNDPSNSFLDNFEQALDNLAQQVQKVYIHLDLDVLAVEKGQVNQFVVSDGLSLETVVQCLKMIKEKLTIKACGIASVNPALDEEKFVLNAGIKLVKTLLED